MPQTQKTAFLFTGQGVLPHDICGYYSFLNSKDAAKTKNFLSLLQNALDEINPDARFNVSNNLANETSSDWNKTNFVQPLIFALSILTYELINKESDYMLGHSLGAFSAITAARSISIEDGMRLVALRSKFMQEESEKDDLGICAVIGLNEEQIMQICQKTGTDIALKNAPSAFVIGAPRSLFPQIESDAIKLGARKTIILSTSGAFHTPAMSGAYTKLKDFLENITLKKPNTPIVITLTGKASTDPEELKIDLLESTTHTFNWTRMMNFLKSQSVTSFVEVGPGTSLSSLCRLNGIERDQISHAKTIIN